MNPLGETITGKTNSSVMTDEISSVATDKLQNTENQVDDNSAIAIAELRDYNKPMGIASYKTAS